MDQLRKEKTLQLVNSNSSISLMALGKWLLLKVLPKLRFLGVLKLSTAIAVTLFSPLMGPEDLQFFIKFIVPIISLHFLWPSHTLPFYEGLTIRCITGVLSLNYIILDHKQGWLTTLVYGYKMHINFDTLIFGGIFISVAIYSILRGIALRKKEGAYRGFIDFAISGLSNLLIPSFYRRPVYPVGTLERKIAQEKLSQVPLNQQDEMIHREFQSMNGLIALREKIFQQRNGECTDCGAIDGELKNGSTVKCYPRHIIYPENYPELSLLADNIIILCRDCGKDRISKVISKEEEEEIASQMRQHQLKKAKLRGENIYN